MSANRASSRALSVSVTGRSSGESVSQTLLISSSRSAGLRLVTLERRDLSIIREAYRNEQQRVKCGLLLFVGSLMDLPNKRRDRIVRSFRLVIEDEHACVGNLHEFKLRVFRDDGVPYI